MNTTIEPGVVGKDMLKLMKSGDLRSLVVRRRYVNFALAEERGEEGGTVAQTVEINIEPYVDGVRQAEQRYEFSGIVRGSIYSSDGHGSTVRPEGQVVTGVWVLWSWNVRDWVNLVRAGDKLTFELQGANNSNLTNEVGVNLNEVWLIIERPNKREYEGQNPGFKRVCRILLDAAVEKAGGISESIRYVRV